MNKLYRYNHRFVINLLSMLGKLINYIQKKNEVILSELLFKT